MSKHLELLCGVFIWNDTVVDPGGEVMLLFPRVLCMSIIQTGSYNGLIEFGAQKSRNKWLSTLITSFTDTLLGEDIIFILAGRYCMVWKLKS